MASKENQEALDRLIEETMPTSQKKSLPLHPWERNRLINILQKSIDDLELYKKELKISINLLNDIFDKCCHNTFGIKDKNCKGEDSCKKCWEDYLLNKAKEELESDKQ